MITGGVSMQTNDNKDAPTEDHLDEEAFLELVLEAQQEARQQNHEDYIHKKKKKQKPIVKLIIWLMTLMLVFNTFAILFQIYSIPAIEFLKVSASLSSQEDIQAYKKAVVEVSTGESKGTGFAISNDGQIVTNHHVIDDGLPISIVFPDEGLYEAKVVEDYPDIDLAILQISKDDVELPYLELAETVSFNEGEHIYFIGNPLYFTGIANEGTLLDYTQLSDWTEPVMMMQAPVYRGNSGSPVINDDGQVIGIVFATTKDDTYGKVGLFVPVDALHRAVE